MAGPQTRKGDTIRVKIDDGTGTYTHYCSINLDRSVNFTNNTQSQNVPDCTDPELPDSVEKTVVSKEFTISGAGIFDQGSDDFFLDWHLGTGGDKRKVIVEIGDQTGDNMITGPGGAADGVECILSAYNLTGAHKQNSEASITIESAGDYIRTPKP